MFRTSNFIGMIADNNNNNNNYDNLYGAVTRPYRYKGAKGDSSELRKYSSSGLCMPSPFGLCTF